MIASIAPVVGGLFLVLGVGVALRRSGRMGLADADTLQRLVADVTMPALLVRVLADRGIAWEAGGALVGTTTALMVSALLAWGLAVLVGADRRAQGSAALTAGFANTGFLGVPVVLALFPHDATASSTAVVVDAVNTTLMLWTVGAAFGARMGQGTFDRRTILRVLLRPMMLCIVVGLALHALSWPLPAPLATALDTLGAATLPLVFLALGLKIDVAEVRQRAGLVVGVSLVKLIAAPAVCVAVVRLMGLPEPVSTVAVLETAMPSAVMSVVVADQAGCDRALAVGVAGLTSLLCLVTLPIIGMVLGAG